MIYGGLDDGNIGRLVSFGRRTRILPLPGSGRVRQQPIHYDDLARLTGHIVETPTAQPDKLSAAGPEVLTMQDIYSVLASAISGPVWTLRLTPQILKFAAGFPVIRRRFTQAQIDRAELDRLPTWPLPEDWQPQKSFKDGVEEIVRA